ncbi:Hairy/enhancer-of-split related with YRPW motif protein 2 [Trichoplax sp. H2]|uniref:BHLH domain-containing protein n=1 Tax=Trichoplax adhaerens TaxID=10228 RepID=B3SA50_TRIAD|nr:hypothetical protein TRIADDRAFT_61134 [Trichoplax adhaerens]EDV20458.1 hypothetical protein TRIADDRAFT_61134 [Trichoplax adhaerens]RDD37168.1 Hairy/enhancer-of-split related with YRPW motif protein 2 [Trichoplax sp. H2]|eukprot:XP_002117152.1 hypothetical protein TRIADDRAFT_61134 [Trichoplax adhaerens]
MKCDGNDSSSDDTTNMESSSINDVQITTRKKKRGIIEKRRRDRINRCLHELKRLVPTAYEKQGSAKLEKAEILQMTVDHLKYLKLHLKEGRDGVAHYYGRSPLAAVDYKAYGFYGCAMELNRYISDHHGIDCSDTSRVRLLNHLESCMNQRFSNCSCSQDSLPPVGPVAFHANPQQSTTFCATAMPVQLNLMANETMKAAHIGSIPLENSSLCSRMPLHPSVITTGITSHPGFPMYSQQIAPSMPIT